MLSPIPLNPTRLPLVRSSPHSAPPFSPTRLKGGADVCAASYGAFVNSGEHNNPEDEAKGGICSSGGYPGELRVA